MDNITDYIIQGLITIGTGIAAYFAGKKYKDAELDGVNWTNFKTMQEAYNKMAEDSADKYSESKIEMEELKTALKESKSENKSLNGDIIMLRQTVKDLSTETAILTRTVKELSSHVLM